MAVLARVPWLSENSEGTAGSSSAVCIVGVLYGWLSEHQSENPVACCGEWSVWGTGMKLTGFPFLLCFLPCVLILYWSFRRFYRVQNAILLAASLVFYGSYGWRNLFFLAFSIVITWTCGLAGWKVSGQGEGRRAGKGIWLFGVFLNLGMLAVFKYAGFAVENANRVLGALHRPALPLPALLLPVGLSFYVFQTTSYLLDLYHGKIRPERNLLTYGAYAAFFPTLISGPIQKSWRTLPLFQKRRRLSYADWQGALFTFLYGGFLKLVIADRLARFTDPVFAGFGSCSSVVLLLAVPAYAVQIYADFAGYSDMAIAVAGLLGFSLHSNFERPYLALTIVDFWRRWHISLTDWFREYLYFPLGGSRKGKVRTYCNVAIVFLVSGLWHGAQWHYVFWGGLHAFYQIFGRLTLPARERFRRKAGIRSESGIYRIWQRLCVFFLTSFAWIFFRNGFDDACSFLACLWKNRKLPALSGDGGLLTLFPAAEIAISFAAAALLLVVSSVRETGRDIRWLTGRKTAVRFACGLLLLAAVAVFGLYGPGYSGSAFIYAGF